MTPRLQRVATDWKTYLGLIAAAGAALTAFEGFFNHVKSAVKLFDDLPPEARWVAVGVLVLAALIAWVAALGGRSVLQRPDRFILSADDPRCLAGREQDVKDLAAECERNPLVFLIGESGAGKSALLQAGLLPFWRAKSEATKTVHRLLPVRIDASGVPWEAGLKTELGRVVASLSDEERKQLGGEPSLAVEG